jgi:hypothetical protein
MGFLASCNSPTSLEGNLEKFDKIYGRCNNPHRNYSDPTERKICESKERAAGPDGKVSDPISITGIFNRGNTNQNIMVSSVNKDLWNGSLKTLNKYAIKNMDFDGGYIETDWIYDEKVENQRCLIKILITSPELISTGVQSNIVCENFKNDKWYVNQDKLIEEEKLLTLQILQNAVSAGE